MGVEVMHFTARSIFYDHYQHHFLHRLFFHMGFPLIYKFINRKFKEEVNRFSPDIIWVFKGMELFPASLAWARKKNIVLVNYNTDNPFVFLGAGSGNANLTNSLKLYDLHFTYDASIKTQLEDGYKVKTFLLPFGFGIEEHLFESCAQEEEVCETCFLGNPDHHRVSFIWELMEHGLAINLYGNNWKRFIYHPKAIVHQPVYGNELWKVLRKYRIQLNLLRIYNKDSHNMRTFEVPSVGGIMVAPDTPDHRRFFEDGKEVFLFKDVDQCAEKIKMILGFSKEEASAVRNAARLRSITSDYSYRHRTEQALHEMKRL